jgi:hypothetical protein
VRRRLKQPESAGSKISFDYATGKFSGITDETIAAWKKAYPAVDVEGTILRQAQWLLASTKRYRNFNSFITNWLSSDQKERGDRPLTASSINAVPEHLRF